MALFHDYLYVPIYNLLIFFVGVIPGGDVGLAVIIVTILVKLLVSPLSIQAVKTQRQMKRIEPNLKALREKYKDNREMQAKEMMSLYKNNGIRPFSSIFAILIQLPILIALYLVFYREALLNVNVELIYSFVALPSVISPYFLGFFETTGHSITLALFAAAAQFVQAYFTIPVPPKPENPSTAPSMEEFGRAMALQTRYVLPLLIGVFAYVSAAIALYFIASSIFALLQEAYVRNVHPVEPDPSLKAA